ncbi:MAG: peptidylprolyl isomerase [Ignavibacteria bacterium]|nr:peptidylprolyl isomerase [Ignavibacteria bacterium]
MTIYAMMQRSPINFIALALLLVGSNVLVAQKTKKSSKKPTPDWTNTVLATVGSESVVYADVERAFQKNLNRRDTKLSSVAIDTALEFLRLYTNYRLKVASARERGMDKDSSVIADIQNNKKLLSETYYFDKAFVDARVGELARRRSTELRIGIILCAVTDPATKLWDSVASMKKAMDVIALLNGGADFKSLANDTSDDKETASNGGLLPWITGGSIIKSVEDEAYRLKVGQHSLKPVSSRFGYFIVKVVAQDTRQVVRFRHILLRKKDGRDSAACDLLADSLLQILNAPAARQDEMLRARGIDPDQDAFSELAEKYSDDNVSASKGGYLGSWYSRSGGMESNGSRLIPEFENGVFMLKNGETSGKVHTMFGVHIIRRDSTRMPDSLAERDNAKRTYRRLYFEDDKRLLYDSLKKVYGYHWVPDTYNSLMATIDTTKNSNDTSWWRPINDYLMQQDVYITPKERFTVKNFTDSLRRRLDMRGYSLNRAGMDRAMNKLVDPMVLEQASANLSKQYADFAALMQEFNDGILLFKVEEKEVWSKLKFDTADARKFFDTTRSRWTTEIKYLISEIYVLTDSAAKAVRHRLDAGESFDVVAAQETQREGAREKKGGVGTLSPKTSKLAQRAAEEKLVSGQITGPFPHDKGYSIIRVDAIETSRPKTFEEALPELAPAYQDALQKKLTEVWLSDVRKRFPVNVNTEAINKIWTKTSASSTNRNQKKQ